VRAAGADRAGAACYHRPGQLVGYPVMGVARLELTIPRYLELLEHSLIDYLGELGIVSGPGGPGFTGVWRQSEKLAAIGIKLNRSVVSHGFALNLTTNLSYFDGIVPCGHADRRPTSVEAVSRRSVATKAAAQGYARHFAAVFETTLEWVLPAAILARGTPVRT